MANNSRGRVGERYAAVRAPVRGADRREISFGERVSRHDEFKLTLNFLGRDIALGFETPHRGQFSRVLLKLSVRG